MPWHVISNDRLWNSNDIEDAFVSIQTKPWDRRWIEEVSQNPKQMDMILFLGCHTRRYVDKINFVIDILDAVGLKAVTIRGGKLCCGTPAQCVGKLSYADEPGIKLISKLSRYNPGSSAYESFPTH